MPAKKKPGIGRVNIRCEDWFADRVAEAAVQTGRSLSSYVRIALIEQMKRDAVSTSPPPGVAVGEGGGEPVRPRGRPKKQAAQTAGPAGAKGRKAERADKRKSGEGKGP
jgi:hypothetical protein